MNEYPIIATEDEMFAGLEEIVRLRAEDVGDFDNLQNIFVSGRKVDKVPTSSSDVAATDNENDVNYDNNHIYVLVDVSGTLTWRTAPLSDFTGSSRAAYKTADTTRTATTTLADDPHLTLAVEANSIYIFNSRLFMTSPTTADFKYGFSVPSGGSMKWQMANNPSTDYYTEATSITRSTAGSPNTNTVAYTGVIVTSSTSGEFTLQWAQDTSDAGNTILEQYSFLKIEKIG